jgi:hypothetical protein
MIASQNEASEKNFKVLFFNASLSLTHATCVFSSFRSRIKLEEEEAF